MERLDSQAPRILVIPSEFSILSGLNSGVQLQSDIDLLFLGFGTAGLDTMHQQLQ